MGYSNFGICMSLVKIHRDTHTYCSIDLMCVYALSMLWYATVFYRDAHTKTSLCQLTGSSALMNCLRRSRYCPYSSTSLCPAPSTHNGSTVRGHRSWMARPWEKSITSSSVPWITRTGELILGTLSILKIRKRTVWLAQTTPEQYFR